MMNMLPILIGLWAVISTILWLVIGWRAMKAHEKIALNMDFLERNTRAIAKHYTSNEGSPRRSNED